MGMEDYGRVLTHSVLTNLVRMFERSTEDFYGLNIFKVGPRQRIMGSTAGIDIIYNPRHMAGYRHPEAPAGKQKKRKVKHIDVTLPVINESTDILADTLKVLRQPGTDHQQWGQAVIAGEADALDILIENRREWARWQLMQLGKLEYNPTTADEIAFSLDFGMASSHKPALSGTARWSEASTCDPITDIKGWKKIYVRDSGKVAKYGIMTSEVMDYMIAAAKVRELLGDRLKDEIFLMGVIAKAVDLTLVVYDQGYVPEGGSFTNYLGTDKFMLWSGETFPEYEGIFCDINATTPGKFAKSFETDTPSGVTINEGARGMPSGERVEELFCATVHQ
jgi:hypothetical protein